MARRWSRAPDRPSCCYGAAKPTRSRTVTDVMTIDESVPAAAPGDQIQALRNRIDQLDASIISLWRERSELFRRMGDLRVAAGDTRVVLAHEMTVLRRFHAGLGPDGKGLALLALKAGRGSP